ncbi:MAG: tRNA (N6-threonylcarbamoyladenosine(37)-N6)-methyltransferase TrmO [Sandaracinaceae bacterium]
MSGPTLTPIGVVRCALQQKVAAPRQPRAAAHVEGRLELDAGYDHALSDLDGFEHIWILAWMDRADGHRSKVLPPRSEVRRGVFATRAPHRPNPIALSVVELLRVEGTTVHVRGLDLLDGTPVLDIKPYIPWADAIPRSRAGWLEPERPGDALHGERPEDPRGAHPVSLSARVTAQLAWLKHRGVDLEPALRAVLETNPAPRPYRRIRRDRRGDGFLLGLSEWRACFTVDASDGPDAVTVIAIESGYRLKERCAHPLHETFDTFTATLETGGEGLVVFSLRLLASDVYVLGGILAGQDHFASVHGAGPPDEEGRVPISVLTTEDRAEELDGWLDALTDELGLERLSETASP